MGVLTWIRTNLFHWKMNDDDGGSNIDSDSHVSPQRPLSADPMNPIQLIPDDSCTKDEAAELPAIQAIINKGLTSSEFQTFFYGLETIEMDNGISPKQIIQILREPANLTINYYEDEDTVVDGYEDEDDPCTVHINRLAMNANEFDLKDKASLCSHEMAHCKGFSHNGNLRAGNENTVPYLMNEFFDEVLK